MIKFVYSEKATNMWRNLPVHLRFINVLGSSLIWTCWNWNICFGFFPLPLPEENNNKYSIFKIRQVQIDNLSRGHLEISSNLHGLFRIWALNVLENVIEWIKKWTYHWVTFQPVNDVIGFVTVDSFNSALVNCGWTTA